ncbi:hypothetical protein [Acidihalobacter ferrooxydans]|uniref:Uncharacterized protein n=1 Tax=Acidihalobacter ferrooxydans TaxID=1765967 RepID=A0A1P8UD59_9GAMM|nr:hypothetical protein [Acidihalobacter ferrooxydans]APZ41716.1 hypothetical protein BW247_00190 [Acidihalobacter ferrooxydans]
MSDNQIGWRRHRACVDYRVWLLTLPPLSAQRWAQFVNEAVAPDGAAPDATGVMTIRGDWGFAVIPPRGFPELKLNCYKNIEGSREEHIKNHLLEALHRALAGTSDHER